MAEKTHCDRCDAVITLGTTNRLIIDLGATQAGELAFVPMQFADPTGKLWPRLRISMGVSREGDGWEGCDLCTVCFLAVLEAFYRAHQGAIGGAK